MHKLDLRNTLIPFSLLRIRYLFKEMRAGEMLEVLWDEPEMHSDLLKVMSASSCKVIEMEEIDKGEGEFRVVLMKKNHKEQEENHV